MAFGTADRLKSDVAEGVALVIGRLAVRRGGRVGLLTCGAPERAAAAAARRPPALVALREALARACAPDGHATPDDSLAGALRARRPARPRPRPGRRGLRLPGGATGARRSPRSARGTTCSRSRSSTRARPSCRRRPPRARRSRDRRAVEADTSRARCASGSRRRGRAARVGGRRPARRRRRPHRARHRRRLAPRARPRARQHGTPTRLRPASRRPRRPRDELRGPAVPARPARAPGRRWRSTCSPSAAGARYVVRFPGAPLAALAGRAGRAGARISAGAAVPGAGRADHRARAARGDGRRAGREGVGDARHRHVGLDERHRRRARPAAAAQAAASRFLDQCRTSCEWAGRVRRRPHTCSSRRPRTASRSARTLAGLRRRRRHRHRRRARQRAERARPPRARTARRPRSCCSPTASRPGPRPAEVAQEAGTRNVPIYTVALGTPDGVVERHPAASRPTPRRCAEVARASGGHAFEAADADALDAVYERSARARHQEEKREVSAGFAAAGLLLLGGAIGSVRWSAASPGLSGRSPLRKEVERVDGGGLETRRPGSGAAPLSSTTPSVSSSSTSTIWRDGDGQELVALGRAAAVQPADLGVGEREELALVGVQEVGGPRPEALVGELQRALDLVALGLDPDALAAELHASQYRPSARRALYRVLRPNARRRRDPAPLVGPLPRRPRRPRRCSTPTRTSAPHDPDGVAPDARASCSPCSSARRRARRRVPDARARRLPARQRPRARGRRRRPTAGSSPSAASTRAPTRCSEARRCLDAGARGHQAAPARGAVHAVRAGRARHRSRSRTSARVPVLIHAGRGIPALGATPSGCPASSRTPG